jgi:hypothetical protein
MADRPWDYPNANFGSPAAPAPLSPGKAVPPARAPASPRPSLVSVVLDDPVVRCTRIPERVVEDRDSIAMARLTSPLQPWGRDREAREGEVKSAH